MILSAIMVAAVGASPTQTVKRQVGPPPPNCGNTDAFQRCAIAHPIQCFSPLPIGVAEW